jgi:hypothetical protein
MMFSSLKLNCFDEKKFLYFFEKQPDRNGIVYLRITTIRKPNAEHVPKVVNGKVNVNKAKEKMKNTIKLLS